VTKKLSKKWQTLTYTNKNAIWLNIKLII